MYAELNAQFSGEMSEIRVTIQENGRAACTNSTGAGPEWQKRWPAIDRASVLAPAPSLQYILLPLSEFREDNANASFSRIFSRKKSVEYSSSSLDSFPIEPCGLAGRRKRPIRIRTRGIQRCEQCWFSGAMEWMTRRAINPSIAWADDWETCFCGLPAPTGWSYNHSLKKR